MPYSGLLLRPYFYLMADSWLLIADSTYNALLPWISCITAMMMAMTSRT
jgi:hypothetical protein